MSEPITCPRCGLARPAPGLDLNSREFIEAWTAYIKCCNPLCRAQWGTSCYHCHHPSYFTRHTKLVAWFTDLGYADPVTTAEAIDNWVSRREREESSGE